METNLYRWYLCVTTGTKGDMIVNSEMSTSDLLCTLFGYTYIKGGVGVFQLRLYLRKLNPYHPNCLPLELKGFNNMFKK